MSIKQIFIFILILSISPSKMLYTVLNESVACCKISLLSDIELESEEEDKKEDTKKEKEEHKFISRYSMNMDMNETLGRLYVSGNKFHLNPSRSTTTPPPDFI